MRWEALFGDLEAQLAAADAHELAGEVADRSRRELARLGLADRARAAEGASVTVGLDAADAVSGTVVRTGPDWWLLREPGAGEVLVPMNAIAWVSGLPALAADSDSRGVVEGRLRLAHALRGIARDRAPVTVLLRGGRTVTGTIDGVGADFIDLAEHAPGEARRAADVRLARTVPFAAIAAVRIA